MRVMASRLDDDEGNDKSLPTDSSLESQEELANFLRFKQGLLEQERIGIDSHDTGNNMHTKIINLGELEDEDEHSRQKLMPDNDSPPMIEMAVRGTAEDKEGDHLE